MGPESFGTFVPENSGGSFAVYNTIRKKKRELAAEEVKEVAAKVKLEGKDEKEGTE